MKEYYDIAMEMEDHHAVFYMMQQMGRPNLVDHIETAEVVFDEAGGFIQFNFNRDFWATRTRYEKKFIIGHECLHVILNHGLRARTTTDMRRANIAMDIVVNHMLVNRFGFDRTQIRGWEKLCWVDTVFPDRTDLANNLTFEQYFNALSSNPKNSKARTLDNHSSMGGSDWSDVIDRLNKAMSDEEKEGLRNEIEKHFQKDDKEREQHGRGTGTGGKWYFANPGVVKKKRKWETVIKKWAKQFIKSNIHEVEQWARINRRFVGVSREFILPTEMEIDVEIEGKIKVWFFQDTSGSCESFKDRFFKAAMSLPTDRFEVKMHCFDTRVFETDLESKKLYGFGGTSFDILEEYIQRHIKANKEKYPQAVFVVTDGVGNKVFPERPERWYWFLSSNSRYCIPEKCNIYMLNDFE